MYQEKKRERRRRDYLRMKERARKVQSVWWGTHVTDPKLEAPSSKLANNISACSCYMCGNPRKWWKEKTFQEIKAEMDANEQQGESR